MSYSSSCTSQTSIYRHSSPERWDWIRSSSANLVPMCRSRRASFRTRVRGLVSRYMPILVLQPPTLAFLMLPRTALPASRSGEFHLRQLAGAPSTLAVPVSAPCHQFSLDHGTSTDCLEATTAGEMTARPRPHQESLGLTTPASSHSLRDCVPQLLLRCALGASRS